MPTLEEFDLGPLRQRQPSTTPSEWSELGHLREKFGWGEELGEGARCVFTLWLGEYDVGTGLPLTSTMAGNRLR